LHFAPGLVNPPSDGALGGFEDDRGFLVAEPLEGREHNCRLKEWCELIEGFEQSAVSLPQLDRALWVAVRIDCDGGEEAWVIEGHRPSSFSVALRVESSVKRDSIDPREELTPPLELRKLVVRLEKRVLRDVVRVARLTGEGQRQRIHPIAVFSNQLVEGCRVAALGSIDELRGFSAAPLCF